MDQAITARSICVLANKKLCMTVTWFLMNNDGGSQDDNIFVWHNYLIHNLCTSLEKIKVQEV